MALHRLLGMEVGVPEPGVLDAFYDEIGFVGGGGTWGSEELPEQIRISEASYRQLRELRVGCEGESDLAETAQRLDGLGVAYEMVEGRLCVDDPLNGWRFVVEPAEPELLALPFPALSSAIASTPTKSVHPEASAARPRIQAPIRIPQV